MRKKEGKEELKNRKHELTIYTPEKKKKKGLRPCTGGCPATRDLLNLKQRQPVHAGGSSPGAA